MALFEVTDYDRFVYESELRDFLPDHIFDVHTHVYLDKYKPKPAAGEVKRTVTWPHLVAKEDSIEDLQETYRLMFPGKQAEALIFSCSARSDAQNDYIVSCMKKTGWPGLYFTHPTQSADEVERKVREGGFVGIKAYLSHSPKYIPEAEIRIFDFFPHEHLKLINRMGGIVMLHIPRHGRLKDPVNLAQMIEIREKYPDVRLIIAHIGRAYNKNDIGDAFDIIDRAGVQMTWDFTANCCETAIRECIRHAGPKNVMFGTDFPILRMRTHRIEENNTYINLVPPGIYGDPAQDPHLREVSAEEAGRITFFAYEELLSFKRACLTLGVSRGDVEDMMCNNALRLIDAARRDIYGI
ncbi:MAG: amidohydrolase [Clostridiales bacterium]|nr:amidohydrolase [Clostridiales bacterium]